MKILRIVLFISLFILMLACKPQVPDKYLQPDEFENILYDYHLADAMANEDEDAEATTYDVVLYRQSVLRKYGITQAQFDSSLVYYMRHADRLHKVYENLSSRFENEAMALGASANDIRRYGDMKSARDTLNIWHGVPAAMFMPVSPYNVISFEIPADSTYKKGDKLILSFNCDFLYNEGIKDGLALLALQFKNDSVASNTVRMSMNSNYSVTVADNNGKGIKSVRGFICLNNREVHGEERRENDLRIMFVDNIRLVRMRNNISNQTVKPVKELSSVKRDTLLEENIGRQNGKR